MDKLGSRVSRYLCLILLFIPSFMVLATDEAKVEKITSNVKGALCYIQADDQVVFVDEVLTKKLSLPGGIINENETPNKAAERETWEETGLVVTAGSILTQTETAVVYHCIPDSGVIAFTARDKRGFHVLPAWFAPDFGIEVKQVLLGYAEMVEAHQYRYPEQYEKQVFEHGVQNSPIQYINSAVTAAPFVHQLELPVIDSIQTSISKLPEVVSTVIITLLKGVNLTSSIFGILFLFPILIYYFGGSTIIQMTYIGIAAVIITLLIQLGLQFPRPFVYQPSLRLTDVLGFSTPSIRAALGVTLIGYLFYSWNKIYEYSSIWRCLALVIVLTLVQGGASVLLGEQFASDVIFGYVIGLLTLWHYIRLEEKQSAMAKLIMLHPALWWVTLVGLAVLSYLLHSIQLANVAGVTLAFALLQSQLMKLPRLTLSYLMIKLMISWLLGGGILFAQYYWFTYIIQSSVSGYFIQCGLWFVLTYVVIKVSCIGNHFPTERSL